MDKISYSSAWADFFNYYAGLMRRDMFARYPAHMRPVAFYGRLCWC